ncbi:MULTISPECIES: SDR family NAD(P)-dependent oxidoreductase [unclassified Sphingomonas]|uniref:SDR family NAD(P)-dependent oxidoreductase n=1 Tax=unclassified Sphingomonas TaxID=196159 RepID=UPI0006F395EA|nr:MULTISPECIES: SDR family oxidoreductase [unclassified Sphingomonas]KQX22641.1 2,5-dichloro-2,5-cyclohexadiene-1,4-diol dehydrogenase [Sphingomonas sp. Root1294]KQY67880.1 2,5-dichloro-2,5-cyclohexadiene-1,4-diol dehydrogenase [Sphingomonas sp. Root50]KRB88804.1 2,5-dichloro-2,5-cyclohexadiene-1,4-diol dehydrogenase [Sphingomonas sp. Root720]
MGSRLKGKIALITGGASGLGAAQALLFAAEGARVVIADVDQRGGEALADRICRSGGDAFFCPLDVASEAQWSQAIEASVERYGALTTLSNTAGVVAPGSTLDASLEAWNRVVAINQTGAFLGMRAAIPALAKAEHSSILNISSLLAMLGVPGMAAYSATKGAVRAMSKVTAMECVGLGIRVNTIIPGAIRTPIQVNVTAEQDQWQRSRIPIGDLGEADDIAYGALYLVSDEAKYVTGAELVIDGGWSINA